jgi:hypothetical protein
MGVLKRSLANFPTDKVDPDAVQFAQNVEVILDAYQAVCADSAELYREVEHQDGLLPDAKPRMPELKTAMRPPQADTLGAVGALIDTMVHLGATAKPAFLTTDAIVQKLRDDREKRWPGRSCCLACREGRRPDPWSCRSGRR